LNLPGRFAVMSQDTGMAMTLIGYMGLHPAAVTLTGTVQSEELQAPMMGRARTRSMRRIAGRGGLPGPTRPTSR
jgi:hypothetical protein